MKFLLSILFFCSTALGTEIIGPAILGGGSAANNNVTKMSVGTSAALGALTRKQGAIYFDTTLNVFVGDDGSALSSFGGGGGSEFFDDVFRIKDDGDGTKELAFEVSAIATGTTRTITMPNAAVNLADVNNAVLVNGTRPFTADQSMGGFKITNLATPTANMDASTKAYVDTGATNIIRPNGANPFTADQSMGGFKLTNLGLGTASLDAVARDQVVGRDTLGATDFSAASLKITNMADPTDPQDATTKFYVDGLVAGFATTELDNLTTTNINANLNGNTGGTWTIKTRDETGVSSKALIVSSGTADSGNSSGSVTMGSAPADNASSGITNSRSGSTTGATSGAYVAGSGDGFNSGSSFFQSGLASGSNSGQALYGSGNAQVNSGPVSLVSGDATTGDSGGVTVGSGTAAGARGNVTIAAPQGLFGSGTAALPSLSFSSDPNTGIYNVAGDTLGFSTNGVLRAFIDTDSIDHTLVLNGPNGTSALPTFSFSGDPNTGMYNVAADSLGFSTNGVLRMSIDNDSVDPTVVITGANGTASLPAFSFSADPDTGVFRSSANSLGLVAGGTERISITSSGIAFPLDSTYNVGDGTNYATAMFSDRYLINGVGQNQVIDALLSSGNIQLHLNASSPSGRAGTINAWRLDGNTPSGVGFGFFSNQSTANDAVATDNVYISSGRKTAGTGDSGNVFIDTGTSAGGNRGSVISDTRFFLIEGGNLGIGTGITSASVKVDIDGAIRYRSAGTTTITADNQSVSTADRSHIDLASDSVVATDRTFVLTQSTVAGQILILRWSDATNLGELIDDSAQTGGGNVRLSTTWLPTQYDTLMLMSTGTDWIEVSRSTN